MMYSRTPRPSYGGHHMGRREPSYRRMTGLPANYGGTAFQTGEPSMQEELPRRPEDDTTPRFEGLPRVSTLPSSTAKEDAPSTTASIHGEETQPARSGGLLSLLDSAHFPFGHGIGYEELLLIGLIFFLMKECDGQGDFKETVILLGLLLLGG